MRNTLLAVLLLSGSFVHGQTECELDQDREGIKVYVCTTADDKLKSVRVEFLAQDATIPELERILDQVPDYTKWQFQVIEASVLERKGDNEMVYRTRLATPALIDDREMVVRMKKKKDSKGKRMDIAIESDPFPYPLSEKLVRVPSSHTTWKVIAVGEKALQITYTLRLDPGGIVPAWVVNEALTAGPLETFTNLKKMLE